jgi:hypothetical protein
MSEKPRLVPLTREQRDHFQKITDDAALYGLQPPPICQEMTDAWDAAPADATEAVQSVFVERYGTVFEGTPSARFFAEDVLRALGMPDA